MITPTARERCVAQFQHQLLLLVNLRTDEVVKRLTDSIVLRVGGDLRRASSIASFLGYGVFLGYV